MCTDGVLETLTNENLSSIFENHKAADIIKDCIVEHCSGRTKDNFSFYIIPIHQAQDNAGLKQNILSLFYSFV